ncbi:MAG TPA: metalloregulator ArsR/SmtB family transcription factor [Terrimesophilobacter sp.]|nr:metalloregulator ArsR/SmtB family transcription factor [Terrimesophilobacter sp.]
MHAFDILSDPVRRRLVELLASGDHSAGTVSGVVEREYGISQPAVARHLRVLREAGFVTVRPDGVRRIYRLEPLVIDQLQDQVNRYRSLWNQRLDALETEIARGKRARKDTP